MVPIKMTLMKRVQKLKQRSINDADVNVLSEEEQRLFEAEACQNGTGNRKTEIFGRIIWDAAFTYWYAVWGNACPALE